MVCVDSEEPWQPWNRGVWRLVGRAAAGNVSWASSSRNGNGNVVSFHMVESVLWHKSLNRLLSSAFNCRYLPVSELHIASRVAADGWAPWRVQRTVPLVLFPSFALSPLYFYWCELKSRGLVWGKQCGQNGCPCFSIYSSFATAQRGRAASRWDPCSKTFHPCSSCLCLWNSSQPTLEPPSTASCAEVCGGTHFDLHLSIAEPVFYLATFCSCRERLCVPPRLVGPTGLVLLRYF